MDLVTEFVKKNYTDTSQMIWHVYFPSHVCMEYKTDHYEDITRQVSLTTTSWRGNIKESWTKGNQTFHHPAKSIFKICISENLFYTDLNKMDLVTSTSQEWNQLYKETMRFVRNTVSLQIRCTSTFIIRTSLDFCYTFIPRTSPWLC